MDRTIQRLDNRGQICIQLWRPPQAFLCVSILGYSSLDNYKSYIFGGKSLTEHSRGSEFALKLLDNVRALPKGISFT